MTSLFNSLSLCDRGTKTLVALSHAEYILHGKANCAIKGFYQSVTYPSKCDVHCRFISVYCYLILYVTAFRSTLVQTSGGSPTSWQLGRQESTSTSSTLHWMVISFPARASLPCQPLMNFSKHIMFSASPMTRP